MRKKYYNKKSKFGSIQIINILMYVIFFCITPIYLRIFFNSVTGSRARRRNKFGNMYY